MSSVPRIFRFALSLDYDSRVSLHCCSLFTQITETSRANRCTMFVDRSVSDVPLYRGFRSQISDSTAAPGYALGNSGSSVTNCAQTKERVPDRRRSTQTPHRRRKSFESGAKAGAAAHKGQDGDTYWRPASDWAGSDSEARSKRRCDSDPGYIELGCMYGLDWRVPLCYIAWETLIQLPC